MKIQRVEIPETPPFRCVECTYTGPYSRRCPECNRAGTVILNVPKPKEPATITPVIRLAPAAPRPVVSARPSVSKGRKTLADVEDPGGFRIDTGVEGLNRVLGTSRSGPDKGKSGLHVPSAILLGGPKGCGKTTLLLTMLSMIKDATVLLLSTEQRLSEIKASLVGIGLEEYASKINACSLLDDVRSVSRADEEIQAVNPRVVVIDSVSDLNLGAERAKDRMHEQVQIVRHYKEHAERYQRVVLMTIHLTKAGKISGSEHQAHEVQVVMMLTRHNDSKTVRLLECPDKNRFGDVSEQAFFEMSSEGLQEIERPEESDES